MKYSYVNDHAAEPQNGSPLQEFGDARRFILA
jgi:hypothetical protein